MAWSTPRTWLTGELVSASLMNVDVRDNLSYLKGSPVFDGNSVSIGAGGTGATNAVLTINGSSAAGQGAYVQFARNGSNTGYVGHASAVAGGATADVLLESTSGAVRLVPNANSAVQGTLSTAGLWTVLGGSHVKGTIQSGPDGSNVIAIFEDATATAGHNKWGVGMRIVDNGFALQDLFASATRLSFDGAGDMNVGGAVSFGGAVSVGTGQITVTPTGTPTIAFQNAGIVTAGAANPLTVKSGGTGALILKDGANGGTVELTTSGASSRIKWASLEATGAGAAALGANCPAVTPTAPYTWLKLRSSDGSDVFIPVWK